MKIISIQVKPSNVTRLWGQVKNGMTMVKKKNVWWRPDTPKENVWNSRQVCKSNLNYVFFYVNTYSWKMFPYRFETRKNFPWMRSCLWKAIQLQCNEYETRGRMLSSKCGSERKTRKRGLLRLFYGIVQRRHHSLAASSRGSLVTTYERPF